MLELELNYKGKKYVKRISNEENDPLYANAVARRVLERLETVEKDEGIVDTQEIAILSSLIGEHEFCKDRDSYRKQIDEANKKISELSLILDAALE